MSVTHQTCQIKETLSISRNHNAKEIYSKYHIERGGTVIIKYSEKHYNIENIWKYEMATNK